VYKVVLLQEFLSTDMKMIKKYPQSIFVLSCNVFVLNVYSSSLFHIIFLQTNESLKVQGSDCMVGGPELHIPVPEEFVSTAG
jgi:hypothetical protein